VRSRGRGC